MREFLEKASVAYYSGYPLISDDEFDALSAKYGYNAVGHTVTDGIPHLHKMYSLQKVFELLMASQCHNITQANIPR